MGIILTADGVAEALFPWVVGKLHDSTGSYSAGFQLLAGLAAAGRHRRRPAAGHSARRASRRRV